VIAPAGPFDHALVWRGLSALSARYRVEYSREMFVAHGFLAGSDQRRHAELSQALAEPGLSAIIAARGGYGLTRIAPRVDWSLLQRHPKWLVGFSDITVMHLEAQRVGVASLHAHNCAGLGRYDAGRHAEWFEALERPKPVCHALSPVRAGQARGTLVGGNLTLIAAQSAARRLKLPARAILVLEEVGEAPYHLDRLLTALLESGDLSPVAGVVLGDFVDCGPGRYAVSAAQVLAERLEKLGVPLASGLAVGHANINRPLVLGSQAQLTVTASSAQLSIGGGGSA
jgi:muramoyltetrapeptide carboxypeptidase